MNEPIKVGDLVQVVRNTECGCSKTLGFIFSVHGFGRWISQCSCCGRIGKKVVLMAESGIHARQGRTYGFELYRLKRIPPLSELEGEKRDEEITA